jgi:hypothetical protein
VRRTTALPLLFCVLNLIFTPLLAAQQVVPSSGNKDFDRVLADLRLLLDSPTKIQESRNKENFYFMLDKIGKGELKIAVREGTSFFDACVFQSAPNPTLFISQAFLSNHKKGMTTSMSLMMYQCNLIQTYFRNKDNFQVITEYKTLRNMLDLDCYYLMGMFVFDHILQSGFAKGSSFEFFLYRSVTKNNYLAISLPLLLQHSDLMNEIGILFYSKLTSPEIDAKLTEIFNKYCSQAKQKTLDPQTSEIERFYSLIVLRSFFQGGCELLSYQLDKSYDLNSIRTWNGKTAGLLYDAGLLVNENAKFLNQYSQKLRKDIGLP